MTISSERLRAIREELEGLIDNGLLNPEAVVDRARNPNSSLHDQFTWDDTEAAQAFRLQEARALIKRVRVEVVRSDNSIVRVPSFTRSSEGHGYVDTQMIAVNKVDHLAVVLITLAQIRTMLANLAAPELDGLVAHVDELRVDLARQRDQSAA